VIAGAEFIIWLIFSSSVILETRSFTRSSVGNEGLRNGKLLFSWALAGQKMTNRNSGMKRYFTVVSLLNLFIVLIFC
jgi:hypothetical protein